MPTQDKAQLKTAQKRWYQKNRARLLAEGKAKRAKRAEEKWRLKQAAEPEQVITPPKPQTAKKQPEADRTTALTPPKMLVIIPDGHCPSCNRDHQILAYGLCEICRALGAIPDDYMDKDEPDDDET